MNLGERIKKLRLKQNLTQEKLSEKAGISRVAVGNYERGDRIPNADVLHSIAQALNVSVHDLMYDVEEIKEDVNVIEKTEKLLNLLGYEIRFVVSGGPTEEVAENVNNLIGNDKIPVCEVYCNGRLVSELTNSQFMQLIDNVKLIVDYELTKNNSK